MITLEPKVDMRGVGACLLIYGDTNSGKTMSALTLEDPVLFINTESKDPRQTHQQIQHNKQITYVTPESFNDFMEGLNRWVGQAKDGKLPFKSVFLDGLTFTQSIFRHELEDSRYGARIQEDESKTLQRGLADRFRFERPDWGSIGSMMSRITYLLNRFSLFGMTVVATAIANNDTPRWGGGVKTAPALVGVDYPKLLHGFFHFIGFITRPFAFSQEFEPIMPVVSFHSEDDSYMARCNSLVLAKKGPAPLDYTKIMNVVRST